MRKMNHRKSDASQPLQKQLGLAANRSVNREKSATSNRRANPPGEKPLLISQDVIQDKNIMSENDAPDKEVADSQRESSESDWRGGLKFEKIDTRMIEDQSFEGIETRRQFATDECLNLDETPSSVAETVDEALIAKYDFMDSRARASCCSRMTFWYANSLVQAVHSNNGRLHKKMIEDMNTGPNREAELLSQFKSKLRQNVQQWQVKNNGATPRTEYYGLTRSAISSTFGCQFLKVALMALIAELLTLVAVAMIRNIAIYLEKEEIDQVEAWTLIVIFAFSVLIGSLFRNAYHYSGYLMALEARKMLITAMYDKVSKLSMRSLTETNSGRLISLVASDVFTLERPLAVAPFVLALPFINIACYLIIWQIAGWVYAIIVFVLWIVTHLMQLCTSRRQKYLKQKEATQNDERMKLINDMVSGIRTIKAYSWENHYCKKVQSQRDVQVSYVFWLNLIGSLGFSLYQNIGFVAILAIFLPKWHMGEQMSLGDSFALLAMVYYLFFSVNSLSYYSFNTMNQAMAVIYRLSEILRMSEHILEREDLIEDEPLIKLQKMEYAWGYRVSAQDLKAQTGKARRQAKLEVESCNNSVLRNISLEVMKGELLVVVGSNGSGKTSFLYSLMDETVKKSGVHTVRGKIAYVEQSPFIISGTIQQNITFGLEYAETRFRKAVSASQLENDLELLSDDQLTIVGENGIKLTDGQKARISLARAIYQDADIYLLDDPLSCVDPSTANGIFLEAIRGYLKEKCIVLVTKQLQFLHQADQILVLSADGSQKAIGTFQEITAQGFNSDQILQQQSSNKVKKSEIKQQIKVIETNRQDQMLTLVRQRTSVVSERDYVFKALMHTGSRESLHANLDDNYLVEKRKAELRKREKNIKLLRKQVMVLAQEELAKTSQGEKNLFGAVTCSASDARRRQFYSSLGKAETPQRSEIKTQDYIDFFNFQSGKCGIVILIFVCLLQAIAQLLPSIWIMEWFRDGSDEQCDPKYPIVFCILIGIFFMITMVRSLVIFKLILKCATSLHNTMTDIVLRAKINFFDSDTTGSIVSRFSQDLILFDLVTPILLLISVQGFFRMITVTITIAVVNWFIIPIVLTLVFFSYCTIRKGSQVILEAQRRDTESRKPIHDTFATLMDGLISLRASDKVKFFKSQFLDCLNFNTNATFCQVIANRWIGIRLDFLCALFMISVNVFVILLKGRIETALLVLSLQISSDMILIFSVSLRTWTELENTINSSKRMIEYTKLELEDELVKPGDKDLEEKFRWPSQGKIEFEEVVVRVHSDCEPSIRNLNFKAQPGMIVGIVGPSGSGKNLILQALFRLVDLQGGRILIDGIDIQTIGLHLLRKSIAIIPQAPFLIQGTIRENIDPFNENTDAQIDSVLREVNMYEKVYSMEQNLNTHVAESNNLFSVGQKQLLCLARAIIRKTRLLVLDEACTNKDLETDNLIQRTLRERFENATVFIIAYRLATIIDADRILVLKEGRLQEYSHPYKLLVEQEGDQTITNIKGQFARMALATGIDNAHTLFEIAEKSYQNNNRYYEPLKNSLSVTDNRTGRTYELQIQNNAISATQLLNIKSVSGNVTRSYDPSYKNTVNCVSRISYVDGEKGILEYRGYPIEQLTRKRARFTFNSAVTETAFTETAFLLVYGQLPSKLQLENFELRVRSNYSIGPQLTEIIESLQQRQLRGAHPMGILRILFACLSSCQFESSQVYSRHKFVYNDQTERDVHIHRIIGQVPAITAVCLRIFMGESIVQPDHNLGYVSNFLRMAFGPESKQWRTDVIVRALETMFILYAEHELNSSTAAMRHMTSSLSDVYSSISGAITAMYGPRHGGACEAVLNMLADIGNRANVPLFIDQVKRKHRLLFGFGHRIYKQYDPRAVIVKQLAEEILRIIGEFGIGNDMQLQNSIELIEVAKELERVALTDEYFITRKLYPNVDFYAGLVYQAIGFPVEYFSVLFALPRISGWMAHWNEFIQDPDNKIARPRQIYLGERARNYTRIEDRQHEDIAAYKVKGVGSGSALTGFELFVIQDRESSEMSGSMDSKLSITPSKMCQKIKQSAQNGQKQKSKFAQLDYDANSYEDEEESVNTELDAQHSNYGDALSSNYAKDSKKISEEGDIPVTEPSKLLNNGQKPQIIDVFTTKLKQHLIQKEQSEVVLPPGAIPTVETDMPHIPSEFF